MHNTYAPVTCDFIQTPAPLAPVILQAGPWVCLAAGFDRSVYHDSLFRALGVTFPVQLQQAVAKRRAEFLAGRYVAQSALVRLMGHWSDIAVGPQRQPLWPDGVHGSISHADDLAVSLATTAPDALLGIDVENLLTLDRCEAVQRACTRPDELPLLHAAEVGYVATLTLLFSAKETLFKALFPRVGAFFDFRAAVLRELSVGEGRLVLSLTMDLSAANRCGDCFDIRFAVQRTHVMTWIAGIV